MTKSENESATVIGDDEVLGNPTLITVREEDPTLASVIRRLAETGWKAIPDGVLWWTLDGDATVLSLTKYNDTGIELNAIVTLDPEKRKKGSGGKTLRALLAVLDELSLGCYLRVVSPKKWCGFRPKTENGLRKNSLRAWYKRHGFTSVPMGHGLKPIVGHPLANAKDVMYRAPGTTIITLAPTGVA
jgi:GNAT superfamily N-acetyltransferase